MKTISPKRPEIPERMNEINMEINDDLIDLNKLIEEEMEEEYLKYEDQFIWEEEW